MSALRLVPVVSAPLFGIISLQPSEYVPALTALPPSPQDPLFPAGLPTHFAPSPCDSDSADRCARFTDYII